MEELKAKSQWPQKLDCLVLDTEVFGFSRTNRFRLGFEV
jgi:hypothetical protein